MFNNVALDVFIGLVFVFLLYSLMATIIQEIIATRFAFRAKVLEKAILRMLEDGKTAKDIPYMDRIVGILHLFNLKSILKNKKVAPWFYAHPLIKYLAEDNWYSKPAYITSANFAKVMLDLLKGFDQPASQSLQAIHDSVMAGVIHKLPISLSDIANPAIKKIINTTAETTGETIEINQSTALFLKSLWEDSGADITVFQGKLEQWFNDMMERATGWFKKYTRIVLFVIGFALAYFFNVDSLAIRRILTTNRTAREQMVQMAIASQEHLNPDKLLTGDSSRLDSTYNLVAADAARANDVLGLGRPWKDTMSMWKDSLKCGDFKNRLAALEQVIAVTQDTIDQMNNKLDNSKRLVKALLLKKDTLKNTADSIRIVDSIGLLQQSIQSDNATLTKVSAPLVEYNRMKFFKERSEYIQNTIGDKWNFYSPNQAGGWETFFGWIITALAIMLGAPFWFDLLSKLISLRGTGTKIDSENSGQPKPLIATTPASTASPSTNNNADQEAVG
ncbi:hypothetical protein [Agriterribacter humi]|uniref:hypothetical protein n=1 Tax=Agriterribacter humi TaxID=1104781 RepID=UPI001264F2B0|nr:hypothetical protein [Agriterribacter humi]